MFDTDPIYTRYRLSHPELLYFVKYFWLSLDSSLSLTLFSYRSDPKFDHEQTEVVVRRMHTHEQNGENLYDWAHEDLLDLVSVRLSPIGNPRLKYFAVGLKRREMEYHPEEAHQFFKFYQECVRIGTNQT